MEGGGSFPQTVSPSEHSGNCFSQEPMNQGLGVGWASFLCFLPLPTNGRITTVLLLFSQMLARATTCGGETVPRRCWPYRFVNRSGHDSLSWEEIFDDRKHTGGRQVWRSRKKNWASYSRKKPSVASRR